MAGVVKDFLDRAWLDFGEQAATKSYATFSSAGGGGREAIDSIDSLCNTFSEWKKLGFKKAAEGIVTTREPSSQVLEQCRELGKKLAKL